MLAVFVLTTVSLACCAARERPRLVESQSLLAPTTETATTIARPAALEEDAISTPARQQSKLLRPHTPLSSSSRRLADFDLVITPTATTPTTKKPPTLQEKWSQERARCRQSDVSKWRKLDNLV